MLRNPKFEIEHKSGMSRNLYIQRLQIKIYKDMTVYDYLNIFFFFKH